MIQGVHAILYSPRAAEVRAFLADVVGLATVDPNPDWPIFALPPAELGIHPTDGESRVELYLLASDIEAALVDLRERGVEVVGEVVDRGWGLVGAVRMPDGATLSIYQPRHPSVVGEGMG